MTNCLLRTAYGDELLTEMHCLRRCTAYRAAYGAAYGDALLTEMTRSSRIDCGMGPCAPAKLLAFPGASMENTKWYEGTRR